ADEINRAPAKTQSALLQAMQERQVTIDRETHVLPANFTVFATQNPIEYEGTYPLPEAQKDRFMLKISMSPPGREEEFALARRTCAAMAGRDFVTPDDIKTMAVPVLEHRLILRPEFEIEGLTVSEVIQSILQQIAVPR